MRKLSLMNLSNCGLEKEEMKEVIAGGACECGCACSCVSYGQTVPYIDSAQDTNNLMTSSSKNGLLANMGPYFDYHGGNAWEYIQLGLMIYGGFGWLRLGWRLAYCI